MSQGVIAKVSFPVKGKLKYFEFAGEHDDTKPTGDTIATGSLYHDVDTGDIYAYKGSTGEWILNCSLGGGEDGGSTSSPSLNASLNASPSFGFGMSSPTVIDDEEAEPEALEDGEGE